MSARGLSAYTGSFDSAASGSFAEDGTRKAQQSVCHPERSMRRGGEGSPAGLADPLATGRFVGAFFDELTRWGVRDVVMSPGSRSTPLAMVAYELSQRAPERLRLFVDVDERGAAFFALGLAKASGRPAAVICTSGTAVANYYPAVMEAESSRVPLVVLTGDRPPRLQGLGAPQTCDQLNAYGSHVRAFRQMPLPTDDAAALAFARQAARQACLAAAPCGWGRASSAEFASTRSSHRAVEGDALSAECAAVDAAADAAGGTAEGAAGGMAEGAGDGLHRAGAYANEPRLAGACTGGPVHLNFPFDEPLTPDLSATDLFGERVWQPAVREDEGEFAGQGENNAAADSAASADSAAAAASAADSAASSVSRETLAFASPLVVPSDVLAPAAVARVSALLADRRAVVLAGEGTCATVAEAHAVLAWARAFDLPLLADPLSGLRSFDDAHVIDAYDALLGPGGAASDGLTPQVIIRFGRYPVSKKATQFAAAADALQIVVDPLETRDFNAATTLFVRCEPVDFARALQGGRTVSQSACGTCDNAVPPEAPQAATQGVFRMSEGTAQGASETQKAFASAWAAADAAARKGLAAEVAQAPGGAGAFVRRVVELAPEGSCLFSANSLSVRLVDTFYEAADKRLTVLANRGLNGIDGTVSSAIGAAQQFAQTTLLVGDLALLHDLNALALQHELLIGGAETAPSVTIVLLNNRGGGIFKTLPQRSEDPYFERLFLTPQNVDFEAVARAFSVPYRRTGTIEDFEQAYRAHLAAPGLSLIEIPL